MNKLRSFSAIVRSSFDGFLDQSADFFGLRVIGPDRAKLCVDMIHQGDLANLDPDSRYVHFNVRFYTRDSGAIDINNYDTIKLHIIERVTRLALNLLVLVVSALIGVLGYLMIINPIAPLVLLIGAMTTVASLAIFFIARYFDHKYVHDEKRQNYLVLKKLDVETWDSIKNKLKDDTKARLESTLENKIAEGHVYVPKIELDKLFFELNQDYMSTLFDHHEADPFPVSNSSIRGEDRGNTTDSEEYELQPLHAFNAFSESLHNGPEKVEDNSGYTSDISDYENDPVIRRVRMQTTRQKNLSSSGTLDAVYKSLKSLSTNPIII